MGKNQMIASRPLTHFACYLFDQIISLCGLVLVAISQYDSDYILVMAILVWYIWLIFSILLGNKNWFFYAFWLLLTAYSSTAWLLEKYIGIWPTNYFKVNVTTIFDGTKLCLEGIFISYMIVNLINLAIFPKLNKLNKKFAAVDGGKVLFASIILFAIGFADWITISKVGLNILLSEPRQAFRPFILSVNYRVTPVTLPCAILLVAMLILQRQKLWKSMVAMIALFTYWTPFLLIGSRRELIYLVFIGLWLASSRERARKKDLILGLTFMMVFYFAGFALRGNFGVESILEFALPQYNLFLLMDYPQLYHNVRSIYTFEKGFWLLLPKVVRPVDITGLGAIFQSEAHLQFGLAFHPMAEAFLMSQELALLFFVFLTIAIILVTNLLATVDPAFGVVGFASLLQWGRSDFWTTVVFIIHSGIILSILLMPLKHGVIHDKHYSNRSLTV